MYNSTYFLSAVTMLCENEKKGKQTNKQANKQIVLHFQIFPPSNIQVFKQVGNHRCFPSWLKNGGTFHFQVYCSS